MSSTEKENKARTLSKLRLDKMLIVVGAVMLIAGMSLFILTFFPVIRQEVLYRIAQRSDSQPKAIKPVDREFSIVIPKIGANSKVMANIDPYDEMAYQRALTKGVAHAKGSVLPGNTGNTFIFAHSAGNWYIANQYNAVFYLLYKLTKGDEIDLFYLGQKYTYKVRGFKYVLPSEVGYLNAKTDGWKTLTLMTCWPPGTTLKRLVVVADIQE